MEEDLLRIFHRVRERFSEIEEKISLLNPSLELHLSSPGWALTIEEFEKLLGSKPEFLHKSKEEFYGISVLYRIDDDITTGIMAHEFAEIVAREKNIQTHEEIDRICVERGFGKELLLALENDVLPLWVERLLIRGDDFEKRVANIKSLLQRGPRIISKDP